MWKTVRKLRKGPVLQRYYGLIGLLIVPIPFALLFAFLLSSSSPEFPEIFFAFYLPCLVIAGAVRYARWGWSAVPPKMRKEKVVSPLLARLVDKNPNRRIIRVDEIDIYLDRGWVPISQAIQGQVVVELKQRLPNLARTYLLMLSLLLNGSRYP